MSLRCTQVSGKVRSEEVKIKKYNYVFTGNSLLSAKLQHRSISSKKHESARQKVFEYVDCTIPEGKYYFHDFRELVRVILFYRIILFVSSLLTITIVSWGVTSVPMCLPAFVINKIMFFITYPQDNGISRIVKWFWLSKAVRSSVVLTLCPPYLFVTGCTL